MSKNHSHSPIWGSRSFLGWWGQCEVLGCWHTAHRSVERGSALSSMPVSLFGSRPSAGPGERVCDERGHDRSSSRQGLASVCINSTYPVLGEFLRAILITSPNQVYSVPTFTVSFYALPWILPETVINHTSALSLLCLSRSFPRGTRRRQMINSRHRLALLWGT